MIWKKAPAVQGTGFAGGLLRGELLRKSTTIIVFIIFLSIIIAVFINDPQNVRKPFHSIQENNPLILPMIFYQVDSLYEEREEELNRRVITVFVKNFHENRMNWEKIYEYGNRMPLTLEGYTAVFFFNNRECMPVIETFTEDFGEMYDEYCIAGYWKYSNGTDIFKQYPFKN